MQDLKPDELKVKLDQGTSVFLKLWKRGCGPCKLSEPACERLEKAAAAEVFFAKICIDEFPEMLEISESEVLPAFFVFKDSKLQGKFIGFKGLAKLKEFYGEYL